MLIFNDVCDVNALGDARGPTYLTIGNFDGLHRGHQILLAEIKALAKADRDQNIPAQTALITFSPHPLSVLRPDQPLLQLTTPEERLRLAAEEGIDIGVVQPFTREMAALSPRTFMQQLKEHMGFAGLVVGPDFALGRDRSGDLDALRAIGEELGFTLHVMEPIELDGRAVRSSAIRRDLQAGDVVDAAKLLGRAYHATGVVVPGDQRGRTIGIRTANIETRADKLLPADGVYATRAYVIKADGVWQAYESVTNLGVRPTVEGVDRRLEAHLLDFPPSGESGDLYGETVRLEFLARLRGEQKFSGLDELLAQIQRDINAARRVFISNQ